MYICQLDKYAFISVYMHVRIYEYSVSSALHNFNIKAGSKHCVLKSMLGIPDEHWSWRWPNPLSRSCATPGGRAISLGVAVI